MSVVVESKIKTKFIIRKRKKRRRRKEPNRESDFIVVKLRVKVENKILDFCGIESSWRPLQKG